MGRGGRDDEHLGQGGRGDEHLGRGDKQDLDQVRCGPNKIWVEGDLAKVVSSFLKRRDLISSGKIAISY